MRGRLLKNTAIYSLAAVVGKIASVLLLPFYAAVFNTEGYGIIGMLDAAVGLLSILFSRGFSTAIVRLYHEQDMADRDRVVGTALWLVGALALVILPLPLLFSPAISHALIGRSDYYPLVILSICSTAIDVSGMTASVSLIIKERSIVYSACELVRLFLQITLSIVFVFVWRLNLLGVFIASLVTAVVMSILYYTLAIREHGLTFDPSIARRLAAFQLPLIPGDLISFLSRQVERILVRILIGLDGVGVLEMAYKFPPLLGIFITQPFLRSWRTKSMEIAETPGAPVVMGQVLTGYLFAMTAAGTVLAVDVGPLLMLLTPMEFWGAARIARVEVVTTILAGASAFMEFGLLYRKRTISLTSITITVSLLKIALSYALVSRWGLNGAAYSACAAAALTLVMISVRSQRAYAIAIEYRTIAVVAIGCAFLAAFEIYVNHASIPGFASIVSWMALRPPALLESTPLASWHGGKLVALLRVRAEPFTVLMVNTAIAVLGVGGGALCYAALRGRGHKGAGQSVSVKIGGIEYN
jgi:O-antigen/teichoic acid export membrane protein